MPLHPQHLHNLVRLYLTVAYGADQHLDPSEYHTMVRLVQRWFPYIETATAEGIVDTAFAGSKSGKDDIGALARELGEVLPQSLRREVLADLGQVARADGFLSVEEAHVIAQIRTAWGSSEGESKAEENPS